MYKPGAQDVPIFKIRSDSPRQRFTGTPGRDLPVRRFIGTPLRDPTGQRTPVRATYRRDKNVGKVEGRIPSSATPDKEQENRILFEDENKDVLVWRRSIKPRVVGEGRHTRLKRVEGGEKMPLQDRNINRM